MSKPRFQLHECPPPPPRPDPVRWDWILAVLLTGFLFSLAGLIWSILR